MLAGASVQVTGTEEELSVDGPSASLKGRSEIPAVVNRELSIQSVDFVGG